MIAAYERTICHAKHICSLEGQVASVASALLGHLEDGAVEVPVEHVEV